MKGAMEARDKWANTNIDDKVAVFLKAADLLSTSYRAKICASTMLGPREKQCGKLKLILHVKQLIF